MKHSLLWLLLIAILIPAFNNCTTNHKESDKGKHAHDDMGQSFTKFSSHFELFAEISPLIKNESSEVIAHFTILDNYKPVIDARLTSILKIGDQSSEIKINKPTRPGIFIFTIKAEKSGTGYLHLIIDNKAYTDTFSLKLNVSRTHDDLHDHMIDQPAHEGEGIVFLKEQAWKTDFAVYKAVYLNYSETIPAYGELIETSGSEYLVTAKHSGIVFFATDKLVPGMQLNKSDDIIIISSANILHDNFEVTYEKTKLDLEKARQNYERSKSMYQEQIISQQEYLTAMNEYEKIQKDFELFSDHFKPGGHHIHIGKKGFLKEIYVKEGQFVDIGQPLLRISNNQRMMLKAEIPLKYKSSIGTDISANFKVSGVKNIFRLSNLNGQLISVGQSLNEGSSLLPVFFEFDNPGDLFPGSFVEVFITNPSDEKKLVVPSEALIENQGIYYLIIQIIGELYEKREVKVGGNDGYMAEILSGLNAGEYIVSKGAYRVYLSSMSSELPEHAHVH